MYLKCVGNASRHDIFKVGNYYEVQKILSNGMYLLVNEDGYSCDVPLNGGVWQFEICEKAPKESPEMDIIWSLINDSEQYNGHSQLTISQMKMEHLLDLVKSLDEYVDNFCDLRISHFSQENCYTASVYDVSNEVDGKDRLLLSVDKIIM